MKRVAIYSLLLVFGLLGSQFTPAILGDSYGAGYEIIQFFTMVALSFIMTHVGYEFDIDKGNLRQYGWDYVVAATAAAFPWILVCMYFVFVLVDRNAWSQWDVWKESLLASRFAAPTSAGVLFSMLAAAGLAATWLYRKARILAIFDDLDTVLLMIPLKMAMVGFRWQLGLIVLVMAFMLAIAFKFLHRVRLPVTWPWFLAYSFVIVVVTEVIYWASKSFSPDVPIHIEVLLPAFVLGCVLRRPSDDDASHTATHHVHSRSDELALASVSGIFMVLVGLSMPPVVGEAAVRVAEAAVGALAQNTPALGWGAIAMHVLALTVVSNVGKMFPLFCYRKEAHWRDRLAVCVAMWPRGEVGAGVIVLSLGYGIGGPVVVVALLSLALNLVLTGVFILMVKRIMLPAAPGDPVAA